MKTKSIRNIFMFSTRRAICAFFLIFLGIVVLTSCQIEKRQYVRGLFINKSTCEFDASKKAKDARDTLTIPQTSEIVLLEQNESVTQINSESTLAVANEISSNEIYAQTFIQSQNEHFNNLKNRITPKYQGNSKNYINDNRELNDEPKKVHPLIIIGLICGILCVLIAGLWFLLSDPAIFGIALFSLSITSLLIGRSRVKKHPEKWKGNKIADILLVVLLALGVLFVVFEMFLFIYMLFTVVY